MTAITLEPLVPAFRERVETLITALGKSGLDFVPYCVIRTPEEQGALWSRSRPGTAVVAEREALVSKGAPYLASCLKDAPVQKGPWATNAVPGYSWHQWGEAVDCYLRREGKAEWSDMPAYRSYADAAMKVGLTAGYYFRSRDAVHIQLRPEGSPRAVYTPREIDAAMVRRFGS